MIIGLPGSGKTYLANKEYVPLGYTLIDDPKDKTEAKQLALRKIDLVICDPFLCDPKVRKSCVDFFLKEGYEIEYIYFENNPKCAADWIEFRNQTEYRNISKETAVWNYQIPEGVTPRKIATRIVAH